MHLGIAEVYSLCAKKAAGSLVGRRCRSLRLYKVTKLKNALLTPCFSAVAKLLVLVYKLPLQSVMLSLRLGLDLKAKIFGLGLKAQVLGVAARNPGLATHGLGLGLLHCGLVNVTDASINVHVLPDSGP